MKVAREFMKETIIPNLWINATSNDVIDYYKDIFKDEIIIDDDDRLRFEDTPSGSAEIITATIKGLKMRILCTGPGEPFTDAVSFEIKCNSQTEIDYYWDAITSEGKEKECGWCEDKYGLRWQIVPHNMFDLMTRKGALETMFKQKKIIISEYN